METTQLFCGLLFKRDKKNICAVLQYNEENIRETLEELETAVKLKSLVYGARISTEKVFPVSKLPAEAYVTLFGNL